MNFLYVLSFLFLFIGCSPKQVKKEISNSKYCANELNLLSVSDSLKKIKIDYSLEEEALLTSIEKKIATDLCGTTTNFGLVLENESTINMYIHRQCADSGVICFRRPREAQVLLNEKGMLLMAYELISIDSIQQWMHKNYSKKELKYTQTSIHWAPETPKDSIEKVFINIIDGYMLVHEDLSQQLFSTQVCDLNTNQLNRLKEELPVKIRLESIELIVDPPPPPPIDVIEE